MALHFFPRSKHRLVPAKGGSTLYVRKPGTGGRVREDAVERAYDAMVAARFDEECPYQSEIGGES